MTHGRDMSLIPRSVTVCKPSQPDPHMLCRASVRVRQPFADNGPFLSLKGLH